MSRDSRAFRGWGTYSSALLRAFAGWALRPAIVEPDPLLPVASRTPAVFILDRMTGNVAAVLANVPPSDPASAGSLHFWADEHIEDLDGTLTYDYSCDALHDDSQFVTMKNEAIFRDLDGEPRLVVIEKVDTLQEGDVHYKRVHCENAAQDELIGVPVRKVTYASATATTILTGICAGSRWQPGQVDYDGIHTITFDNISALEALRALEDESSLEPRYRVTFSGSKITGRYIDLLTRRGSDTGVVVEYAKDLLGLTMTDDGMLIYTRHIPLGRADASGNRLSIIGITWTAPGDPMDKPAGEDYLDAPEATALYGPGGVIPIARFIDLPDCVTTEALINAAYPIHVAESQPQPTYEISLAFLEKAFATSPGSTAPYGQERKRLGDGITIRNRKLGVVTTQRIRRVVTSYSGLTSAPSLGGQ